MRAWGTPLVAMMLAVAPVTADAKDLPGFGDSEQMPTGQPFKLPAGLELEIKSYNAMDIEATCKRPDAGADEPPRAEAGLTSGFVRVCLQFRNKTREPINVDLPPGLIFISESRKIQHGLVFQGMNLEVPAEQDLYAPIKADCMNASRSIPGVGDGYKLGPVTDSPHIREALGLLAGRDISSPMDSAAVSMIMKPLYLGKPLTNEARAALLALPRL